MVQRNISLKQFNTFGIDVKAAFFSEFQSEQELKEVLSHSEYGKLPVLPLGGGSNILFTGDYNGLVLRNNISGIELIEETEHDCLVNVGAGVVWHELVKWCIERNYSGIENLSLIPGCTGAAPIQNIGAYGVELKNVFHSLKAVEFGSLKTITFDAAQCQFGYRDSIFKRSYKGKSIITGVTLKLSKVPDFKLSYGAIELELKKMGVSVIDLKSVSNAVCNIRRSKLPDPVQIGNAGSFFKNPEVSASHYENLKIEFPTLVAYPLSSGNFKLAAGWMIEQCGWKGKRVGNTGSHKDQALVLVNYGGATGEEILNLSHMIRESVKTKFDVDIEPEVNVI